MSYYNAVILSGGSIKSISTLGALQYCYDNNLIDDVNILCGTSAGAIIIYLLAIGYTPTELISYICTNDIFKHVQYLDIASMINGDGAISFTGFQEHLEKLTIDKIGYLITMEEVNRIFNKFLIITTYNYTDGKIEYITPTSHPTIPCIVALRMSACLPLIFDMYKYMGKNYIDGGIGDNFPVKYVDTYLKSLNDNKTKHILGILLENKFDSKVPSNIIEYIYTLMSIPLKENIHNSIDSISNNTISDIITIESTINMFNYTLTSQEKLDLFSIGYQIAKNHFN